MQGMTEDTLAHIQAQLFNDGLIGMGDATAVPPGAALMSTALGFMRATLHAEKECAPDDTVRLWPPGGRAHLQASAQPHEPHLCPVLWELALTRARATSISIAKDRAPQLPWRCWD